MIKIYKTHHRDQERIFIKSAYNEQRIANVRQIEDNKWSRTHKAWHVPCNAESIKRLKKLFPDHVGQLSALSDRSEHSSDNLPASVNKVTSIAVDGRKIVIKTPKNQADIEFLNTLKYSQWNKKDYCWEVPHYPGNLEKIKTHFKDRIASLMVDETIEETINGKKLRREEVLIFRTKQAVTHYFQF